jgi:hypothetical protein
MAQDERARYQRLEEEAEQRGLRLIRSGSGDRMKGRGYFLFHAWGWSSRVIVGGEGATLDEIEAYLNKHRNDKWGRV